MLETVQVRTAAAGIEGNIAPTAIGTEKYGGNIGNHTILANTFNIILIEVTCGVNMAVATAVSGTDTEQQNRGVILQLPNRLDAAFAP